MSFKFALGAVIAVVAGAFMLPGLASAHSADLHGEASECRDAVGAFSIDWTLTTDAPSNRELDGFDDTGFDTGSNDSTESPDDGVIDVVDGGVADSLGLEDFTDSDHGNTLDIDGIHGDGSASAQTSYDGSDEPNAVIYAEGRVQWTPTTSNSQTTFEQNVRSNDVDRPDYCVIEVCIDGETGVEQFVNDVNATNDCDPVRLCLDGDSDTVTEFQADNDPDLEGATEGSCVPGDNPPPPPPVVITETPPVEEEVSEVSPAVDEVAALPSTGSGGTTSGGFALMAIAALALIGIGGGVTVVARKS